MKKSVLLTVVLISLIIITIGLSYYFYQSNLKINKKNAIVYEQLESNQLVDVTGEISLSEIKSKNKELISELKELFNQETFNKNDYLKQLEEKTNNNTTLKKQTEQLTTEINNLTNKKNELTKQYSVLKTKYNNLQKQQTNVNTNNSYNFPLINQYPNYPTGCESVSLTMLLRYYGINVTPDNVISKLKKENLPYYENGVKYGGNPEIGFIGNPYSSSSYGVYEKPIAAVANYYKSGIQIKNNFSFQEVINLAKNNHPVLVWTSMGLALPYISNSLTYKPTMEKIYWKLMNMQ